MYIVDPGGHSVIVLIGFGARPLTKFSRTRVTSGVPHMIFARIMITAIAIPNTNSVCPRSIPYPALRILAAAEQAAQKTQRRIAEPHGSECDGEEHDNFDRLPC